MPASQQDPYASRDTIAPAPLQRHVLLLAQVAGLLATGWIVWSVSVLPRLAHQPLAAIVTGALKHALLAGITGAVITLGLYLLIARSARVSVLHMALRTSATAVWFAPATILLSALSPAALAAALVLVVSVTRLLYSQWLRIHPPDSSLIPVRTQDLLFELPPPPLRLRDLIPALVASFGIQAGILAVPMGYPLLAAALFCLSVAMLTLSSLVAGMFEAERTASLPRSVLGVLLTVILAAGLTVGGLAGGGGDGFGGDSNSQADSPPKSPPGPFQSARELAHKILDGEQAGAPKDSVTKVYLPPSGSVEITDTSFPGVILFPEVMPPKALVAPSPSSITSSLQPVPAKPLTIPFTGQYWMFKPPYARPPRASFAKQGSPLALSFVTTDHRPMNMEARQLLDHAIDLSCCRGIQIVILNVDRYPGTVTLELVLIDTDAQGQPSQSLGITEVASRPQRSYWGRPILPVPETLDFPIARTSPLREFNEIKVVFHRDRVRIDRSAKISIERFLLVPKAG